MEVLKSGFWIFFEGRTSRIEGVGNRKFNLKHVAEVPTRHPSREITSAVGFTDLKLQEEFWIEM